MNEPPNEVDKNIFSLVRANSHCKEEVIFPFTTEISMIVSIFLSLSHCALDIFAIGKQVNHIDEYRLGIPTNLQFLNFHGHEKPIKLAKM